MVHQDSIRFLALGDWGKNTDIQRRVADLMRRLQPCDGVLALGDNFYELGVRSVNDPLWQSVFFDVYHTIAVAWYAILGNHDYMLNPRAQIDFSNHSGLWRMPHRYYDYKFYWGPHPHQSVHLIAIDTFDLSPTESYTMSNLGDVKTILSGLDTSAQLAWIDRTLRDSESKYKIVMGHYPVFSDGYSHGDNPELIRCLKPFFDTYNVNIYVSGHDHCLGYRHVGNTHYIVSGAGSMVHGTSDPRFQGHSGICEFLITEDQITVYFRSSTTGETLLEKRIVIF